MTPPAARPPRTAVLIVIEPDGHVEVYAEPHVDVHIARVPAAHSREAERLAEDVMEMQLPPRYRALYRADHLRRRGTTVPLLPSVAHAALIVRDQLAALDRIAAQPQEEVTWTL